MKSVLLTQEQIDFLLLYIKEDTFDLRAAVSTMSNVINNSIIYKDMTPVTKKRDLVVSKLTYLIDIKKKLEESKEVTETKMAIIGNC